MGSNAASDEHHAINIEEVNSGHLELLQEKISKAPGILSSAAGQSSCCIFKVPNFLKNLQRDSYYKPKIVSFGPYHHGDPQFAMIEEHKGRWLGILLERTKDLGLTLEDYWNAVEPLEVRARLSYSENFQFSKDEFIEMLILDGCFIIELFRKSVGEADYDEKDPLISMLWCPPALMHDLLLLENQIPFFILKNLTELTKMPGEKPSMEEMLIKVFRNYFKVPDEWLDRCSNNEIKHVLDFCRQSLIPPGCEEPKDVQIDDFRGIPSIQGLRLAEIEIKERDDEYSFLAVRFRDGVIEMPALTVDDFTGPFMLNCVAFEQCFRSCSQHMTTYFCLLLDFLVVTEKDAQFLRDKNILKSSFGTEAELVKFIKTMSKNVTLTPETCYLRSFFTDVNESYNEFKGSYRKVQLASLKAKYFSSPWALISVLAAFVILVLTFLQTIYTILGYVKPR